MLAPPGRLRRGRRGAGIPCSRADGSRVCRGADGVGGDHPPAPGRCAPLHPDHPGAGNGDSTVLPLAAGARGPHPAADTANPRVRQRPGGEGVPPHRWSGGGRLQRLRAFEPGPEAPLSPVHAGSPAGGLSPIAVFPGQTARRLAPNGSRSAARPPPGSVRKPPDRPCLPRRAVARRGLRRRSRHSGNRRRVKPGSPGTAP